jgi:hypothetical protein
MKPHLKIAVVLGALALASAPAMAIADQSSHSNGHGQGQGAQQGHGPQYTPAPGTPGPSAGLPEKAKAYGRYCQGESKKHEAGEKGTPFSQCVTAMAKAAKDSQLSPGQACKGMSKKHTKGEKGTPYSRCVSGAAKLRKSGAASG